ncbi:MAG: Rrf2 family transcriptional regulator [Deltaproteobacteria bacterium]|nr:Rrf2 family transcriptional regulator [Deltaproteobacteria bacterium]
MFFSDTTEYALRALTYLAQREGGRVSVRELHDALGIPQKYLGAVMARLVGKGLLCSRRGIGGGFQLVVDPEQLTVFQIADAVQDVSPYAACLMGLPSCSDEAPCALHHLLGPHRDALIAVMHKTTLADLAREAR